MIPRGTTALLQVVAAHGGRRLRLGVERGRARALEEKNGGKMEVFVQTRVLEDSLGCLSKGLVA